MKRAPLPVFDDKSAARAWARGALRADAAADAAIQRRLLAQDWFWMATPLGLYRSVGAEVATDEIWAAAKEWGWETAAPRSAGAGYAWHRADGGNWREGPHGIPEPEEDAPLDGALLRAVVAPGLAFDVAGNRLGHGGGHYDRLLAAAPGALKIGLCPECRLAGRLLAAPHDVPVDVVATERRILFAPGAEKRLARMFGGARP